MIKKFNKNNKIYLLGFHAQKSGNALLRHPKKCTYGDAWLGEGYYFWLEEEFAHYWGQDFKVDYRNSHSYYCIYTAYINKTSILDATFSENGYNLFRTSVEEAISDFKSQGLSLSLEKVHKYLADKIWPKLGITGIIYDDLPQNSQNRNYSESPPLFYKKRLQLVVFDLSNIEKFDVYKDMQR